MQLTSIKIEGVMQGPIWWPAGEVCETTFRKTFNPPRGPRSPFSHDWCNLDEALQLALSSGDFQGGMGEIACGEITFEMTDGRKRCTVSKPLDELAAARPYFAEEA